MDYLKKKEIINKIYGRVYGKYLMKKEILPLK